MNSFFIITIIVLMIIFTGIYLKANRLSGIRADRMYTVSLITLIVASGCYIMCFFYPSEMIELPWNSHLISIVIGAIIGTWISQQLGMPEILTIRRIPILWTIVGSGLFVVLLGMITGNRRRR